MKKIIATILILFITFHIEGQQKIIDSLRGNLAQNNDTLQLVQSSLLCYAWGEINEDSAIWYGNRYLDLSKKLDYKINEADALQKIAWNTTRLNSSKSLKLLFSAEQIASEDPGEKLLPSRYFDMLGIAKSIQHFKEYRLYITGSIYGTFSFVYFLHKDYKQAILYDNKLMEIAQSLPPTDLSVLANLNFGLSKNNPDSSLFYLNKSYRLADEAGAVKDLAVIDDYTANAYRLKKDSLQELKYKRASLQHSIEQGRVAMTGWGYVGLADFYNIHGVYDSALFYCYKAKEIVQSNQYIGREDIEYWVTKYLYELYKRQERKDSVLKYMEQNLIAFQKTNDQEKLRLFRDADYSHQERQAAINGAKEKWRSQLKLYSSLAGLAVFILLSLIFWRNSIRRRQEFIKLERQRAKTDQAMQELKSAQAQLIQSEKMASLGELTAGIAHEIQNPLNFVNNFSEVNTELLAEMKQEIGKENFGEVSNIAEDILANEQKINQHGKRAEAIVKGMLQHSRTGLGQKEPTDINALAEEYLHLTYHGFRAKDKSFNVITKTDFDNSIGKINVVPQDIGRVLLNLFNNAFYAVNEKRKLTSAFAEATADTYEPLVSVCSKKLGDKISISVKDNGNGIPQKVVDKIFQPFFTTKPTGQGTGLGLSLSYDIVKAHGGEIKVGTKEGEGTEFIITLPLLEI